MSATSSTPPHENNSAAAAARCGARFAVTPAQRALGGAYHGPSAAQAQIDLWLDANEGQPLDAADAAELLKLDASAVRRYPQDAARLEAALASELGVEAARVLVTAGADDALYRVCLALLEPAREMILPTPTFEMLGRYARIAGGIVRSVDWPRGPYPTDAVCATISQATALIAFVSPNNPSGAIGTVQDLRRISAAAPRALILADFAYIEYADADLTAAALALPNVLVTRTFSKAWGLAGLRVGYALGPPTVIEWLRSVGNPYAVSGVSLAIAQRALSSQRDALQRHVAAVRSERAALHAALLRLGADASPSQGNFVLARHADAAGIHRRMAQQGISVRVFPGNPQLADHLRITCPGDVAQFTRLLRALERAMQLTVSTRPACESQSRQETT